jgi:hypothetical protein
VSFDQHAVYLGTPGAVCEGVGPGTGVNQVETMRSKLKRLTERGILAEFEAGLFALASRETDR